MLNDSEIEVKNKRTVAYSALTFFLLLFICQSAFGMIVNIFRNVDMYAKLQIVKNAHKHANKVNNTLRYELDSFNSAKSLEAIARNNLKMAAANEILLIINTDENLSKNKKEAKKRKEKGIFYRR